MKLRTARIEYLTGEILKYLEDEHFIEISDSDAAYSTVFSVIRDDLMVEVKLDEEVRLILEDYAETMDQDRIQYHEMFKMVKSKLAKERNLIL